MKNIGIDIGGTSIKGAVIESGTVTARAKRSTDISRGLDSIRASALPETSTPMKARFSTRPATCPASRDSR